MACEMLGVDLVVVTIWLELGMPYSSRCHHPPPSPLAPTKSSMENVLVPANAGPPGKMAIKTQASSERDRPLCRQRHLSNML